MRAAVISVSLVLLARAACPQTPGTATVTGRVTDPQGKVVGSASVSLVCEPVGLRIPGVTNRVGQYVFSSVLPGMYTVEVEATDFAKTVAHHVRLAPAATVVQDFELTIGVVTSIVDVSASAEPLETGNAAVETQVRGRMLQRLPSGSRQVSDLLLTQPGSHGFGFVHGAQIDQNSIFLDGVEVTDVTAGFSSLGPIVPIPTESVEEFRAILANPPPQAALGTGAQFAIQTKSGRGDFHGSIYGYDQNSALNANLWPFNRSGIPRPDDRRNRFGVSGGRSFSGGRTSLFALYEGNRWDQHGLNQLAVPSESLRQGLLRFRDPTGNIQTVNPKMYDPRGIGANPLVLRMLRSIPAPNGPPNWPADGLNTGTYNFLVPMQGGSNIGLVRLEHNLTADSRWRLDGSARMYLDRGDAWGKTDAFTKQSMEIGYTNQRQFAGGLTTIISPAATNRLQLAWTQSRRGTRPMGATPTAPFGIAADLAGDLIGEPISVVGVPYVETVTNSYELSDQFVHQTGRHRFQVHASMRHIPILDLRNGTGWGSQATSTPVASIGAAQSVAVPAAQRPSFLQPWDIGPYNTLYSTLLGIVDQVSVLRVRDGRLNPLPLGTNLLSHAAFRIWEFSFNDTWRPSPGVTVTLGLTYGWQGPPLETGLRQMMPVYVGSGEIVRPMDYLRQKREAAEAGRAFTPAIGFEPLAYLHRDSIFHPDRRNISPRASASWNPSFGSGWLRAILGDRRSVIRGGYSLLYDRTNTPTTMSIPAYGVGFGETDFLTPLTAGSEPFRAGIDGDQIPLPAMAPAKAPIIPSSQLFASALDPNLRTPYSHVITVALQRQLPARMLLEVSYVGRMARRLYEAVNLNSVPYMFRDVPSGQTLAQAFDAVAAQLRSGVSPDAVTPQPWFEHMLPGRGTQHAVTARSNDFIQGNLSNFGLFFLDKELSGFASNGEVNDFLFRTAGGRSNYHSANVTLHKDFSSGLQLIAGYSLSKSLNDFDEPQGYPGIVMDSYNLGANYGPSSVDQRHTLSTLWLYELPFGRSRKLLNRGGIVNAVFGGWFISGIGRFASGMPLTVISSWQGFGGGIRFPEGAGAIEVSTPHYDGSAHHTPGSDGVGTSADPLFGGSGLNRFADPAGVYESFRRVSVASDRRSGRGALRDLGTWNADVSAGKMFSISERARVGFSVDFLNAFNHVIYQYYTPNLNNPRDFGVIFWQANSPRVIQPGLRIEW